MNFIIKSANYIDAEKKRMRLPIFSAVNRSHLALGAGGSLRFIHQKAISARPRLRR